MTIKCLVIYPLYVLVSLFTICLSIRKVIRIILIGFLIKDIASVFNLSLIHLFVTILYSFFICYLLYFSFM